MTHPEELLADYVDGSLGDAARAGVDAHLAECARCRDEVGRARSARAALRGLPQVEAPAGVTSQALREAARSRSDGPPRYARILPIAAAAVLVGLLAIALPRLGENAASPTAQGSASGTSEAAGDGLVPRSTERSGTTDELAKLVETGVQVEKQQVDYDDEALRTLVDDTATQWRGVAFPTVATFGAGNAPAANAANDTALVAARCVYTDVPEEKPAILVRLIEATYQGKPAYLGVVLEGTEPGKPADRAVIWIVRKDDCSLARLTEQSI
jgi:putative zinc finger protein